MAIGEMRNQGAMHSTYVTPFYVTGSMHGQVAFSRWQHARAVLAVLGQRG